MWSGGWLLVHSSSVNVKLLAAAARWVARTGLFPCHQLSSLRCFQTAGAESLCLRCERRVRSPGGHSRTTMQVKDLDVEVLDSCGFTRSAVCVVCEFHWSKTWDSLCDSNDYSAAIIRQWRPQKIFILLARWCQWKSKGGGGTKLIIACLFANKNITYFNLCVISFSLCTDYYMNSTLSVLTPTYQCCSYYQKRLISFFASWSAPSASCTIYALPHLHRCDLSQVKVLQ